MPTRVSTGHLGSPPGGTYTTVGGFKAVRASDAEMREAVGALRAVATPPPPPLEPPPPPPPLEPPPPPPAKAGSPWLLLLLLAAGGTMLSK